MLLHAHLPISQVLSGKPTKERTKFGTSGRTDKLVGYEGLHLGGVGGPYACRGDLQLGMPTLAKQERGFGEQHVGQQLCPVWGLMCSCRTRFSTSAHVLQPGACMAPLQHAAPSPRNRLRCGSQVSQGVTTDAVPAFGHQPASRCKTAPSIR